MLHLEYTKAAGDGSGRIFQMKYAQNQDIALKMCFVLTNLSAD